MDRVLQDSVTRGDLTTLRKLVEHDETIIRQAIPGSLNTALHLAARFGHRELVVEILKWCPDMVSAENSKPETPLHEACREGHLSIVRLLLEINPGIAYKVNGREESVLFAACERGKVHVVKHLMECYPMLLMLEVDMAASSLHVAASSGSTDIVKEILKARPEFAWKKDLQGCTPLHLACSKGHLDTAKELLRLDSDLCLTQDSEGRPPLHSAVMKGRINVIDEILSLSLESAQTTMYNGETILHLAVKNNQLEVVKYLVERINTSKLLNMQDTDGNTILHLAVAAKLTSMVLYLLKIGVDMNCLNGKGFTALDVVEADGSNSGALVIGPALLEAGAKRCPQLSPGAVEIQVVSSTSNRIVEEDNIRSKSMSNLSNRTPENFSPRHHHHTHNRKRAKRISLQNEGLRNARKTITIVAVLIASVTFTAGINPPGGFDQKTGKAIRANRVAFKVFLVCNIVALFLSIGVVNVHVSIIPFTRRTMTRLMTVTHKVMWVATLLMTAAYIAAIWTIMPEDSGTRWVSVDLVVFGGGCTIITFSGLGWMLVRHWQNKYRWRKVTKQRSSKHDTSRSNTSRIEELRMMRRNEDSTSNSDVDSSDHGYHLY